MSEEPSKNETQKATAKELCRKIADSTVELVRIQNSDIIEVYKLQALIA